MSVKVPKSFPFQSPEVLLSLSFMLMFFVLPGLQLYHTHLWLLDFAGRAGVGFLLTHQDSTLLVEILLIVDILHLCLKIRGFSYCR